MAFPSQVSQLLATWAGDHDSHESSFAVRSFCSCRDCKAARALGTRIRNRLAIASSSEYAFVNLLRGCEWLGV